MRQAAGLLVLLAAVAAVTWAPVLDAAGGFLVVHDSRPSGDVAVVLSGDAMRQRLRAAVALARRGAVGHIVVLTGTPPEFYDEGIAVRAFARRQGVAPGRVTVVGAARSTVDDARLAAAVMRARGWRRAVVVTSASHTRRAGLIFCRVWRGTGLEASTYAVDDGILPRRRWWADDAAREAVILEYVKLAVYLVRYGPMC